MQNKILDCQSQVIGRSNLVVFLLIGHKFLTPTFVISGANLWTFVPFIVYLMFGQRNYRGI